MKKIPKNVVIFIGLMIIVGGNVFIQLLSNLDEIWIFNFAKCMADGLLPYRDISMIITPLFPMISAIFLKIFGNEMIVLRVAEVIEVATILFLGYKLLRRLNVNEGLSIVAILRNISNVL